MSATGSRLRKRHVSELRVRHVGRRLALLRCGRDDVCSPDHRQCLHRIPHERGRCVLQDTVGRMTVAELIAQLATLPPDMRVIVRAYEYGVNDIGAVRQVRIEVDGHAESGWWAGQHKRMEHPSDEADADGPIETAAFIEGAETK